MATRTCANCTYIEVNAAINGAPGGSNGAWQSNPLVDGDIVNLPSNLPTSATWTLAYNGVASSAIAANANAAAVQSALDSIPALTGNTSVSGSLPVFFVRFINALAKTNVSALVADVSALRTDGNTTVDCLVSTPLGGTATADEVQSVSIGNSWGSNILFVTKSINIIGATTVVRDAPVAGVDSDNFTVVNRTNILDGHTTGSSSPNASVINCVFPATGLPLVKGITLDGSPRVSGASSAAMLFISGANYSARVTQCVLLNSWGYALWTDGGTCGIIDHSYTSQNRGSETLSVNHNTYNPFGDNGTYDNGAGSWKEGPNFTSHQDRKWYYEDCSLNSDQLLDVAAGKTPSSHGLLDGQSGGRRVVRHCYLVRVKESNHGTESNRSMRQMESYLNHVDLRTLGTALVIQQRGGGLIMAMNRFDTDSTTGGFRGWQPIVNREYQWFPNWDGANGRTAVDRNDTEGNGTYVAAHAASPHQYYTGQVASTQSNLCQVTPDPGWTNGQWTNYWVYRANTTVHGVPATGLITGNTHDTLTVAGQINGNGTPQFTAGETVYIYKLIAALDQGGRGKGDEVTGFSPPTNTAWPRQNVEPWYAWLNTVNGAGAFAAVQPKTVGAIPTINPDADYFNPNPAPSFNPCTNSNQTLASGTAYGLLANRPTHCTPPTLNGAQPQADGNIPGVAYWATDTNELYVCTATDTWTLYWTAHTYPHPLTTGDPTLGKRISIPTGNMDFGNVINGQTKTATLTISNPGDDTLTVSSITYPTGYSGAYSGTIAAGASHDVTVTFSPVSVATYSGTITVNSDAGAGTNTVAVTGNGVAAAASSPSVPKGFTVIRD